MSKFVVSARKYRPATFDEVVGQNHVAKTLKNALQTEQLAHAFLFCGPRGVGKTTCARILAKVINCENAKDKVEPCNECSSCKSFNDNASFNIIELDAASNNSVEHIRTLIEQVRFQPQQGTHKVFIIDEVHMLSSQAFNAFLKTLEEPPPYAIFILATTEKHKIIPTILSRCQIFDFKRIQVQDAVKQLEYICKKEGKSAEPEALHLIAQKADGAMRDALSIFDKIASASNTIDGITYKDVIANLNILDYDYYFKIVDAFLREDLSDVLLIMDEIVRQGFEPEQFIQGLAAHMRDLLVCKDSRTIVLLEVSDKLKSKYQHQAALTSKSILLTGLDILNQCDVTLPRSKNKRLYTEIALSKINFSNRSIETHLMNGVQPLEEKKTELTSNVPPKETESQQVSEISVPKIENTLESEGKVNSADNLNDEASQSKNTSAQKSEESNAVINEKSKISALKEIKKEEKKKDNTLPKIKKLSGVEAILASVKAEEEKQNEARRGLNIETINKIWDSYIKDHNSPSTRSMLKLAKISLEGKIINVVLPSNHYKTMLLEEDALKDLLRIQLGTSDLSINPIVNKEAFPDMDIEKPKIIMSTTEKGNILIEKHPLLGVLIEKLDLKAD
ncbi:MAG: DNA polymerase III subunit gamma/tau [Saprospiraceae bacterium]